MRTCGNCYNGHFNLSDRGEEMYCDESGYDEVTVLAEESCEDHRYLDGYEEEKNYIFYDETYLGPGFFIINKQEDEIAKYFKIYIMNNQGFPSYGIRAFSTEKNKAEDDFETIKFTFRDIEDYENGLYKAFIDFYYALHEKTIETIDKFNQGRNQFCVGKNNHLVALFVTKDIHGVKDATNFIDINIGDNVTCENYMAIANFYKQLCKLETKDATEEEIQQLLLIKKTK